MTLAPSTCRFCKDWRNDNKVKYGTRHYACYRCYLEHKDAREYEALPDWQKLRFPYRLIVEFGLTDIAHAAHQRLEARK